MEDSILQLGKQLLTASVKRGDLSLPIEFDPANSILQLIDLSGTLHLGNGHARFIGSYGDTSNDEFELKFFKQGRAEFGYILFLDDTTSVSAGIGTNFGRPGSHSDTMGNFSKTFYGYLHFLDMPKEIYTASLGISTGIFMNSTSGKVPDLMFLGIDGLLTF